MAHCICLLLGLAWAPTLSAQSPAWSWATRLHGGDDVFVRNVCASPVNGCFAHGDFQETLYFPFDTLGATASTERFVVHVDSMGSPTWAVQFKDEITSFQGMAGGGVRCLVAYSGSTVVQGQQYMGDAEGVSVLLIDLDVGGGVTSALNLPGFIVGETAPPRITQVPGIGIAVTSSFADSIRIAGQWLYGSGMILARMNELGELIWAQVIGCGWPTGLHMDAAGRTALAVPIGCDPLEGDPFFGEGIVAQFAANGELLCADPYLFNAMLSPVLHSQPAFERTLISTDGYPVSGGSTITVSSINAACEEDWSAQAWATASTSNQPFSLHGLEDGGTLLSGMMLYQIEFGPIVINSNDGPDGFVALLNEDGDWQWVVRESSGNVYGTYSAPGTNARIYTSGFTDTGATFDSHQLAPNAGHFCGFVACLDDVTLASNSLINADHVAIRPNPTSDLLFVELRSAAPIRILDAQGRVVLGAQGVGGTNTINVRALKPGPYAIEADHLITRFIKE